jgi:hypothetical protein
MRDIETIKLPQNGKEFERWCKWVARNNFGPHVFLYERYDQKGVDICWLKNGKYYIIQCKQRNGSKPSELINALEYDFKRALSYFGDDLEVFIFATTANLETVSKKITRNNDNEENLLDVCNRIFIETKVNVTCWHSNYIKDIIADSPFLLRHLLNLEEGADLIDQSFFLKFFNKYKNTSDKLGKREFYGGQDDIQWYGILKNWDASREIYGHLIDSIEYSFNKSSPVAAVIRGDGGSGKSIFLRRLAHDLRNKYTVYWVGYNIEAFLNNEFEHDIKLHPESKYLIILEDWYRNIEKCQNISSAHNLLSKFKNVSNARLLIGDRKSNAKIYDDFVLSENVYDLLNTENKKLLDKVFEQMPNWKNLVKDSHLDIFSQSTLFIILFCFCYDESIVESDLKERYKRIFKSDFKQLLERKDPFWKGIANALYLFANFYSQFGLLISYGSLIELACYYGNCSLPKKYQTGIAKLEDDPMLKKYLHVDEIDSKTIGKIIRVKFHHDIISEQGWSVKHELIEIEYNDNSISEFIEIIKSKNFSELQYLYYRLSKKPGEKGKDFARKFLNTEEPYLIQQSFYECIKLLKDEEETKIIARNFLHTEKPYLKCQAFCLCLELMKDEEETKTIARNFLRTEKSYAIQQPFCNSLKLLKNEDETKIIARNFLQTEKPYTINSSFSACITLLKDEEITKIAARDFLQAESSYLASYSFCTCLELLKNEEDTRIAAKNFLRTEKPYLMPSAFSACVKLLRNENETKLIARNFLQTEKPYLIPEAFSFCVELLRNEKETKIVARNYLQTEKSYLIQQSFCACIELLKNEDGTKIIARDYLKTEKPHLIQRCFCICIELLKNEEEARFAARNFLRTEKAYAIQQPFNNSFELLKNEEETKISARNFLKMEKPYLLSYSFCTCLRLLKNEEETKIIARNFLQTEKPYLIQQSFCSCIELLDNENETKIVVHNYLQTEKPYSNQQSFCISLELLKNEEVAKIAARNFFKTEKPSFYNEVSCSCLRVLDIEAEEIALEILENYKFQENWAIVYYSIKIIKKIDKHSNIINHKIEEIIKEKDWLYYREILKIPLFDIPVWLKEVNKLINTWEIQKRSYIYSLTLSHFKYPDKIKEMSLGIIRNWKHELSFPSKHKAYFTRCLANPSINNDIKLKNEVINICTDIIKYNEAPLYLTANLEEWIKKIITSNEFPQWTLVE